MRKDDSNMAFKLYLVRHGRTMLNHYRRLQGWCDSDLNDEGIAQANAAGRHLAHVKFDKIYYSGVGRTLKTAQLVIANNDYRDQLPTPVANYDFREQGFGFFEGNDAEQAWFMAGMPHGVKTYDEIVARYGMDAVLNFLKEADPFKDAENTTEFWTRVNRGLDGLRQTAHDGDNILITGHSILIRHMVNRFKPEFDILSEHLENGSVTRFTVTADDVTVDYYNHSRNDQEY